MLLYTSLELVQQRPSIWIHVSSVSLVILAMGTHACAFFAFFVAQTVVVAFVVNHARHERRVEPSSRKSFEPHAIGRILAKLADCKRS